jgi:hypothetical protein
MVVRERDCRLWRYHDCVDSSRPSKFIFPGLGCLHVNVIVVIVVMVPRPSHNGHHLNSFSHRVERARVFKFSIVKRYEQC